MSKVFNENGSLTYVIQELNKRGIYEFTTLNEILNFLKNSPKFREKILDKYRDELLLEKFKLPQIISNMEEQLIKEYQQAEKNVVNELHYYNDSLKELQDRPISIWSFKKKWKIKKLINQITSIQENKDILIQDAISPYIIEINEKKKRYDLLMGDFEYALAQEAQFELVKFDEKFSVFRELRNNIYGAIGEQKVIEELKNLGHDCIVINDFKVYFNTPLINKKEDYYINSIQVDHLAITRAGVFIIETKNWSANSQQKIDLRSPIEQVRRTGYAVYHLLNNNILMKLRDSHHWGQKNINTRNVVVLIQSHSTESFQFVKLVNLNQLNGYIQYFQPEMTINEVEKIAEYFLNLNNEWLG